MRVTIFVILTLLFSTNTWAGSQSNQKSSLPPEKIIKFAKEVEKYAAKHGARAFIIARVGRAQNELPKGIKYTHTAIAVYSDIQLTNGETASGYAIHNLYQQADNPNRSKLVQDYPVDFFWAAHSLKAGIIIPSDEIQTRLIELIATGKSQTLHNPRYSVIANPMNQQRQNCTEHTLDLINAAIYQTTDIEQIKANTQAYFTPQPVKMNRFKLMFGAMLMEDITTKDHKRNIATATFGSINRYLQKYDLVEHSLDFYAGSKTITW